MKNNIFEIISKKLEEWKVKKKQLKHSKLKCGQKYDNAYRKYSGELKIFQ